MKLKIQNAPLRKVESVKRANYPSTYPFTVQLECGHWVCRERRPSARVRCAQCSLQTPKPKTRKPAPKVTGVKTKQVATVGTPLSGTLSVEVAERGALVNDLSNAFTGEVAGLQLRLDVDGFPVAIIAWPNRLVVFDEHNVLKSRKTVLFEVQNKVAALLEKWAEAVEKLGAA